MESLSAPKHQSHGVKKAASSESRQLTKALFRVNIQNSLGPIQVILPPETTVGELTKAAIGIYVAEKQRPLLGSSDPGCYELHYSQFALESLKPEEKLVELGSRNFFLCRKRGHTTQ